MVIVVSLILFTISGTDTTRVFLPQIVVDASRTNLEPQVLPLSYSVLLRDATTRQSEPVFGMDKLVRSLPGVTVLNRETMALGERLQIRGMGWRSPFGVRGITVVLDGIPLTAPDGQTILEIIDPGFISQIELIRGPSSLLWGNGSGGTLFLKTVDEQRGAYLRSSAGSYGFFRIEGGARSNHVQINAASQRSDGYREHSYSEVNRLNISANFGKFTVSGLAASSGNAQNPGALTKSERVTNPTSANPLFISRNASKKFTHIQTGIRLHDSKYDITVYGIYREVSNPIIPAIITINRIAAGSRFQYTSSFLSYGFDTSWQSDGRKNWTNTNGIKGPLLINQHENYYQSALFLKGNHEISRFILFYGLRTDLISMTVNDKLNQTTDLSGQRLFIPVTASAGLAYSMPLATLFANLSTSFQTPTLNELSNNPDGLPGFNPLLDPEKTTGLELGVRALIPDLRSRIDIAAYYNQVQNLFVAYQIEGQGNRLFYRNGGSGKNLGIELATRTSISENLVFFQTFSLTRHRFDDGNRIPGLPELTHNFNMDWSTKYASVSFFGQFMGKQAVNDMNSEFNPSWFITDVQMSSDININGTRFIPFFRINNLTDARYAGSVSINATNQRFYEPAAARYYIVGLSVFIR